MNHCHGLLLVDACRKLNLEAFMLLVPEQKTLTVIFSIVKFAYVTVESFLVSNITKRCFEVTSEAPQLGLV